MDKLKFLPILCLFVTLCACSSSDDGGQLIIDPSGDNIVFSAAGGTQELEIGQDWTLEVSDPNAWCTAEVRGTKLILNALSNSGSDNRWMKFYLRQGTFRREVNVLQYPVADIKICDIPGSIPIEGGEVNVAVESNIPFKISISEEGKGWLNCSISHSYILHLVISPNRGEKSRLATISLVDENGNVLYTFTISQKGNQPLNMIYYTTVNGSQIVTNGGFGGNFQILSHTYLNGEGMIVFSGNILAIGENAFSENSRLVTMSLPEGIKTIGKNAFKNCYNLKEVNIPEGVNTIEDCAFSGCSSLKSIIISHNCVLGREVFAYTGLEHFSFPEMQFVPYAMFRYCEQLQSVQLPEGLQVIGEAAFVGCAQLKSVNIPSTTTDVYKGAFSGCTSIENLSFSPGVCFEVSCFDDMKGNISLYPDSRYGLNMLSGFKGTYVCPEDVTPEALIGSRQFLSREMRFGGKYASEDCRCLIIDGSLYIANLLDYENLQYDFPKGIKKVMDKSVYLTAWDNAHKSTDFFFFAEGLEEMGYYAIQIDPSTYDHAYSRNTIPVVVFPKSFKKFTGNSPLDFNIGCFAIFNSEIPPQLGDNDIFGFRYSNVILVPENAVEKYKSDWPMYASIIREGSIDDFVMWQEPY